jgi:hypothetical protein
MKKLTYGWTVTAAGLLSLSLLPACSRATLQPNRANVEEVMEAMCQAQLALSAKDGEAAESSDEGRRAAYDKLFIEPIRKSGYDPDASLQEFAKKLINDDCTPEERGVIEKFLPFYVKWAGDLGNLGLIDQRTAELLEKVQLGGTRTRSFPVRPRFQS